MSDMDAAGAAEMLAAANRGELDAQTPPGQAGINPPEPVTQPSSEGAEGATAEPDSFTGLDPNSLPPEMQPWYRSMQADYVRKTQALAEQRKTLDGLDVNQAKEAIEFVNSLQTDPQYAMAVHAELSTALEQYGLTPAQAAAAATAQLNDATETPAVDADEYGEVNPEILNRLQRAEQFIANQEAAQAQQQYEAQLSRQEMQVRQLHPDWTDDDINTVYALAYSHGGDLLAAEQGYQAEQQRIINRYFTAKGGVPSGEPKGSGPAVTPENLTPKEIHARATEMLAQTFAN